MGYYVVKRYFFTVSNTGACAPFWVKTPHWDPVQYTTWAQAADAYIQARFSNVRALGVPGYPSDDLDIVYEPEAEAAT